MIVCAQKPKISSVVERDVKGEVTPCIHTQTIHGLKLRKDVISTKDIASSCDSTAFS
jgi:hypothetical protein